MPHCLTGYQVGCTKDGEKREERGVIRTNSDRTRCDGKGKIRMKTRILTINEWVGDPVVWEWDLEWPASD